MLIGNNRKTGEEIDLQSSILRKHVALLGSTGSGKTVAAKVLIEEATLEGIPSIIIDPQGDLARLAITANRSEVTENGGDAERSGCGRRSLKLEFGRQLVGKASVCRSAGLNWRIRPRAISSILGHDVYRIYNIGWIRC